jgi:hypothetical protein
MQICPVVAGVYKMTEYQCRKCGKIPCRFVVPDSINNRDDLPTVCPWEIVIPGEKRKINFAKWVIV